MFAYYNQVDEPRREIPTTAEFAKQKEHDQKVAELTAKVNSAEQGSDIRKKLESKLAELKKSRVIFSVQQVLTLAFFGYHSPALHCLPWR